MKLLVVTQYYFPEQFRITDICEELARRGHSVTVLTGLPCYNFPNCEIPQDYKKGHFSEVINGVNVFRVKQRARKSGAINRFLNYYSFANKSKKAVKKLDKDFDVIFVNGTSPVMQANAAIKYKKKYGKPIFMYCLDLWPASLTAGGIKENFLIYKHYHKVSKKIYGSANKLAVTSHSFIDYFKEVFNFDTSKIIYLPQYAETLFDPQTCKKSQNEYIDLVFAGNIGVVQSVKTVIEAANRLKEIGNLRWHIVGDGVELENCKRLAEKYGLKSITFYGKKPLEDMPKYYSMADAMLVTLNSDKNIGQTIPGKVQGYMAAGKPIIGAIGGETARVIEDANCGFCGAPENVGQLADNVLKFIELNDKERIQLGENAKKYNEQHFDKDKFFEELERELLNLI